jgi:hypothetical protein
MGWYRVQNVSTGGGFEAGVQLKKNRKPTQVMLAISLS